MRIIKIICMIALAMMVAAPALAAQPEFDAVGCDAYNIFAVDNDLQFGRVINENIGPDGPINYDSDFYMEGFNQTAGQLFEDPCFPMMDSALTDQHNESTYMWKIVLQMKPQSDIDLNIYDCILTRDQDEIFGSADQTGRVRTLWGDLEFLDIANPSVTVMVTGGEFATPGFRGQTITMDTRKMPSLNIVAMEDMLYTSKALWDETMVLVLPLTGTKNTKGQTQYDLKQGDIITVNVAIPPRNTVDVRYGEDSVLLQYIGIEGTYYYANNYCYPD